VHNIKKGIGKQSDGANLDPGDNAGIRFGNKKVFSVVFASTGNQEMCTVPFFLIGANLLIDVFC